MLDDELVKVLALDDDAIARDARNVNRVLSDYVAAFPDGVTDAPACRALVGESEQQHLVAHLGAFQWLQGVRIMQHLVDYADALSRRRVLAAGLAGRAVISRGGTS